LFGCPLCLRLFERTALVEDKLSLEHIVPSGRGAANETLTCKACNNTTGSRLDADLLKRIAFEERLEQEGGPVRCEVITGEGRHNAHLYIKPGESPTIEIIGLPEQSNPRLLQKAVEEFPVVENFTLNWNAEYVHARSQTAMLRSAYLTMFRYYGYGYVLHPALNCVREQIEQPIVKDAGGQNILRHEAVLRGITTIPQPCPHTTVVLVTSPSTLRSFMVHLGLSSRLSHSYAVMLPGPQEEAEAVYKRLEPQGRFDFSILEYLPEIVATSSLAQAVHRIWQFDPRETNELCFSD